MPAAAIAFQADWPQFFCRPHPSPHPGLSFLEACRSAFQQACRRGAVLPRGILEVLVLVLRNDAVHRHPHVSRQAYR